jgi:hypothetical protein
MFEKKYFNPRNNSEKYMWVKVFSIHNIFKKENIWIKKPKI